jgi:hypothetical protein
MTLELLTIILAIGLICLSIGVYLQIKTLSRLEQRVAELERAKP